MQTALTDPTVFISMSLQVQMNLKFIVASNNFKEHDTFLFVYFNNLVFIGCGESYVVFCFHSSCSQNSFRWTTWHCLLMQKNSFSPTMRLRSVQSAQFQQLGLKWFAVSKAKLSHTAEMHKLFDFNSVQPTLISEEQM